MKKLLTLGCVLWCCSMQLPVSASDATNWAELTAQAGITPNTIINLMNDITVDDHFQMKNKQGVFTTTLLNMNGHTITGSGSLLAPIVESAGVWTISNGTFTNGNSTSYSGAINDSFGNLTLNNVNFTSNKTLVSGGAITTNSGIITINSTTGITNFTNNEANVAGGAINSANGTVNINATGGDVNFSGNKQAGGIANDICLQNSILNLNASAGRTITINDGISSFGGGTNNTINKSGDGLLVLNGVNTGFSGAYKQTAGTLSLGSSLTAESAGTDVSGGMVTLTGTGTNLTLGGKLASAAIIDISLGNTLTLTGASGDASLNSNDIWNGAVNVLNGSKLTLDGVAKSTTATATYNQTDANLVLKTGANLILATSDSKIDGTVNTINIQDTSSLSLKNGSSTTAKVTMASGGASLTLSQDAASTPVASNLTLSSASSISAGTLNVGTFAGTDAGSRLTAGWGSVIGPDAVVNTYQGGTLYIDGGNVTLHDSSTSDWDGNVYMTTFQSILTLDNYDEMTTATSTYNQFMGTLNLTNDSDLVLATSDSMIAAISVVAVADTSSLTLKNGTTNAGTFTMASANGSMILGKDASSVGSSLEIYSGSSISAGTLNVGTGASDNGNILKVDTGANIASNAIVNIFEGNTLSLKGGTSTLNDSAGSATGDAWSGNVSIITEGGDFTTGGTLTLNNFDKATNAASTYNQSLGILNLTNGSDLILAAADSIISGTSTVTLTDNSSLVLKNGSANAAKVTMASAGASVTLGKDGSSAGSSLALNSATSITAGTVNIGAVGDTGNQLTVNSGATVATGAVVNIFEGNTLNLTSGNLVFNDSAGSATGDSWNGLVNMTGGTLTLNAFDKTLDTTTYRQNTGTLNLTNDSDLNLAADGLIITNGSGTGVTSVNVGTSGVADTSSLTLTAGNLRTAAAGDTLTLNIGSAAGTGNSLVISGGILDSSATVRLYSGNTLNVSGTGSATLNAGDTVAGNINLSGTTSSLTLNNLDKTTAATTGTYTQTSGTGTLNLLGTSKLDLADSGSTITAGTVNIGGASDTGNELTLSAGSVADAAIINLASGNTLSVSGTGSATLNSGDTVEGKIDLSGTTSSLTFDNLDKTTVATIGTYTQTSGTGTLNLLGTSRLELADSGSVINAGTINIGSASSTGNELAVNAGVVASSATVNLYSGNLLSVSGTGNVTLNTGDTCFGTVDVSGTGILKIEGNLIGKYTQTDSTSTLDLLGGSRLELADSESSITAGTVNIGGSSDTGNELALSAGSVASATMVELNSGNTLSVSGSATVVLNSGDMVGGNISLSGTTSSLTLDNLDKTTVATTGTFTKTGGTLNLTNDSDLTLESGSSIKGGTVTIADAASSLIFNNSELNNSKLNLSAGSVSVNSGSGLTLNNGSSLSGGSLVNNGALNLEHSDTLTVETSIIGGGSINKNAAGTTTFTGDVTGFSGIYSQTAGTVNIRNSFFNANNLLTGGTVNIDSAQGLLALNAGDSWTDANISNSGGTFNMSNIAHISGGTYNQSSGDLNLTNGAYLELGTGNSISGGNVNIGSASNTGSELRISSGSFGGTSTVNLASGNALSVSGAGSAILNVGDTVAGKIDLSGATSNITFDNLDKTTVATVGTYTQTGGTGTLNLLGTSRLELADAGSTITAGTINIGSASSTGNELAVSAGEVGGGATVNMYSGNLLTISGTGKVTLNTGDDCSGTLDLSGTGILNIEGTFVGKYTQIGTQGDVILNNGSNMTLTSDSAIQGGTVNIGESSGATGTNTLTADASLISSSAQINITGQNSSAESNLVLNYTTPASGTTFDKKVAMSGFSNLDLNIASGQSLTNTNNTSITGTSTDTLVKEGAGSYNLNLSGTPANATIGYGLAVNNGTMNIAGSNSDSLILSGPVNVGSTTNHTQGALTVTAGTANFTNAVSLENNSTMNLTAPTVTTFVAPVSVTSSTMNIASDVVNFNNGLILSHGLMNILNQGFNVNAGGITVGSVIDTMNGVVATNNITGDLAVGASGIAEFAIDINPSAGTYDKYTISGGVTGPGEIKISDFEFVGDALGSKLLTLKVFDASTYASDVIFTSTNKIIKTAVGDYSLSALDQGSYNLSLNGYNPSVFRGQVATIASYANQLTTNNIIFDHIDLVSQQLLSEEKPNMYANSNPLFAPYQYSKKDGGLWTKAFSNIERLGLTEGINTQNNMWGTLVGADLPLIDLKRGWKVVPTAYLGYTGGYQSYKGVSMYQNGGQVGAMGTFYKDDFITSLLANVGGYGNDMSVGGTTDSTGNWFVGVASKSAYNIKLPKDFILQPTALVGYSAFGKQNWSSDYGKVDMNVGMMNGLNVAPGLNLILNKETWSVYATTQLMFNVMNGAEGGAGSADLPTIKMASTYFQYGVGFTKRIKDRLTMYTQILMSNGVRTGVGFQGGLQWKI